MFALLKSRLVRWVIGICLSLLLSVMLIGVSAVLVLVGSFQAAPAAAAAGGVTAAGWSNPAVGRIVSPFGPRTSPCVGCSTFHEGDDIGASCNAPIHAAQGGVVTFAGWTSGYGNFIIIDSGAGLGTAYGHIVLGGIHVTVGQQVTAGQQIANVGSTGHSTGCHLHFEVRMNGKQVDPIPVMTAAGITLGVDQ